jgi:hypothetical protein
MLSVIARAPGFGLAWLAPIAISVAIAYGLSLALTTEVSTTTRGDASVQMTTARPVGGAAAGGDAWVTYVGNNCWLPDPSGQEPCVSQTGSGR